MTDLNLILDRFIIYRKGEYIVTDYDIFKMELEKWRDKPSILDHDGDHASDHDNRIL